MADTMVLVAPEQLALRMAELGRFLRSMTWTGEVERRADDPDAPAMTVVGDAIHQAVQDGCWILGDYEQTEYLPDGSPALLWQMHIMCGWSPSEQSYVATVADNFGRAMLMHGFIAGNALVLNGRFGGMYLRMTWRITGADTIVWTFERSVDGSSWTRFETHNCLPD